MSFQAGGFQREGFQVEFQGYTEKRNKIDARALDSFPWIRKLAQSIADECDTSRRANIANFYGDALRGDQASLNELLQVTGVVNYETLNGITVPAWQSDLTTRVTALPVATNLSDIAERTAIRQAATDIIAL